MQSGSWTKLGDDIIGETANDNFGISVSLSGDGSRRNNPFLQYGKSELLASSILNQLGFGGPVSVVP